MELQYIPSTTIYCPNIPSYYYISSYYIPSTTIYRLLLYIVVLEIFGFKIFSSVHPTTTFKNTNFFLTTKNDTYVYRNNENWMRLGQKMDT